MGSIPLPFPLNLLLSLVPFEFTIVNLLPFYLSFCLVKEKNTKKKHHSNSFILPVRSNKTTFGLSFMIAEDKREVLQRAGGEEPSHRIQEVSVWLWREGGGMEPLYETAELSSNHYTESHGHFVKAEGWKRRQKQRMVREKERKKKGWENWERHDIDIPKYSYADIRCETIRDRSILEWILARQIIRDMPIKSHLLILYCVAQLCE